MKRATSSTNTNKPTLLYLLAFASISLVLVFWALSHQEHPHTHIDVSNSHKQNKNEDHDGHNNNNDHHHHETDSLGSSTKEHNNNHDDPDGGNDASSLSNTAKCMIKKIHSSSLTIKAVGSHPIGTYVCSYLFPNDKSQQKSCTVKCPLKDPKSNNKNSNNLYFSCQIREKARSKSEATSPTAWDLMFFHYGAPPVIPDPQRQLVVFYSGESNITEAKRAKADYQAKFSHVVSCHHSRRFYFTWTARHVADFVAIANSAKSRRMKIEKKFLLASNQKKEVENNNNNKKNSANAEGITTEVATLVAESHRKEWHQKINAAVIFITRCGKGGRDKIVEALRTNGIPVHSFGKCQRTHILKKEHPECINGGVDKTSRKSPFGGEDAKEKKGIDRYAEKLCVFRKYRYVLALENSAEEDYVTEKIYHGLIAGAIPLYLGSPNIDDFVPLPGSYIPLSRYYYSSASSQQSGNNNDENHQPEQDQNLNKKINFMKIDSDLRTDPKTHLNFEKMKEDMEKLDKAAADSALGNREENAGTYWLDSLLEWRRVEDVKQDFGARNPKFLENLFHEEPTCDLCNLALQRKCEPGA